MESEDILFLRRSLSDFPLMIWRWDLPKDTFSTSAEIANFLRDTPTNVIPDMESWIRNSHPEDRPELRKLRQNLRSGSVETFSLIYRIRDCRNDWHWVMSQGQITARDENGTPLEATGITVDQTRHKEMERIARQNRLKLQSFFDTLDDLLFVCNRTGVVVEINDTTLTEKLFGHTDLKGKNLKEVFLNAGADRNELEQLFSEQSGMTALSISDSHDRECHLEIKIRHGLWDGEPALLGICHDFTDRKRALKELQLRREQLELALDGAEGGLWDYDLQNDSIILDERSAAIVERQEAFVMPFSGCRDYIHPEDLASVKGCFERHLAGQTALMSAEYRIVLPSGRIKWILHRGRLCRRDAAGKPLRMRGTLMDITEHKEAEEARRQLQQQLAESEARLKLALEATEDGIWDWDLKKDEVFISNHWVEMLGYTCEDIPNSAKVLFEIMHPEDKEAAREQLHRHLAGETPSYEAEFRALTRDGQWKWILSRGRIVSRDGDGEPLRIVGTHTDISGRIKTQQKISELEAQLREASARDSLTGVLNRQQFRRILNREADRSLRYSSPLALILINFDRFNLINSEYGHQAGDRLLVEAARLMTREIRSSDTLARWSGEEFIILTPEKLRGALSLAEKLRMAILNSAFMGLPPVSASFGVASYRSGEKVENLIQRVDIALYKAKKHQGNRVASQE